MAPNPQAHLPSFLTIRHEGEQRFVVIRQRDGKSSNPVVLTAPDKVVVRDRPNSHLLADLGWYLERFLDYPFEPNTEVAERIQNTLKEWGTSTFAQLFSGQPLVWYEDARRGGLEHLVIKIASDDPRMLAWPWEALCDPAGTTLAHTCRIERQLSAQRDPQPLPEGLSEREINILMIIARPYGDRDVGFHAVAGPLVEWIRNERVPVRLDVLRPPTFAALQERLKARPGHYHIVHFDGHGGYADTGLESSQYEYRAPKGLLVFEDEQGNEHEIEAAKLSDLLTEYRIPIMVLNACRSASIDARAEDPFASTAAALLKGGIRSVVAMGYNLYVSGAQQFVPAFYRRLIESGNVAEATRAGRQAMRLRDGRVCARGTYPLQDWLVPVLYQQDIVALPAHAKGKSEAPVSRLPEEAQTLGDYGFIGRQDSIHQVERALLRQPAAGVLIHGMAGVGKTTLARGLLQWLEQTGGLGGDKSDSDAAKRFAGALWFSFDDIRSAEYVVNRLTEALFGYAAISAPLEEKRSAAIKALRETPYLLVWDNFESAAGIEGTEVSPLLPPSDRALLKNMLNGLRSGASKVLITSRSQEDELTPIEVFRLPLRGLHGEDAWAYCNAVVRDLGLELDRKDPATQELLTELDGHPLALRAVLLQLADVPARELLNPMRRSFENGVGDDSTRRIFAALSLLDQRLPEAYAPMLQRIGLHQRYVDIDYVAQMISAADGGPERAILAKCFGTLERGGLIHSIGNGMYSVHPALPGFLARAHPAKEVAITQFVEFMATYANQLAPKELHEQRGHFAVHGANFQRALALARSRKMADTDAALTQALGAFAQNSRDFTLASRLFNELALQCAERNDGSDAGAYHQLGIIAQEQRDFAAAERWYQKSLAIEEKQRNEQGAATTYHQLGMIAQEQRDFATAERWYQKSLAIEEKQGNDHGAARTYHHLGMVAQEQRDFAAAERWYQKSLAIEEKQRNEQGAATTYHQLGIIAQLQPDFVAAERWYQKALAIFEKQGNEHSAAFTYHHLGMIAQGQRDLVAAERWYQKSLAIEEKQGNDHGASITYHQLGLIAQEQRDLTAAASWYQKSLAIEEKQGNDHGAARTYHQLGIIAQEQRDFAAAERWYQKSLAIKEKQGNNHGTASTYYQLGVVAHEQRDFAAAERCYQKSLAITEKQGNDHGAATSYGQLGLLSAAQGDFERGGIYALDAVRRLARANDQHNLSAALRNFVRCLRSADTSIQATLRERWNSAGLEQLVSLAELEKTVHE